MKENTSAINPPVFKVKSQGEDDTFNLGRDVALFAFEGLCILLSGELGTGKTVFTRGFVSRLGTSQVRSPSFTLVNEYEGHIPIAHADLYRLSETDGYDIGLFDYQKAGYITIIEWGERWNQPPHNDLWQINFDRLDDDFDNTHDPSTDAFLLLSFRCFGERACNRQHKCRESLKTHWSVL
jgi:tRNA threonylcarbamoyladenosine biosynthesis protein TsaE